MAGRIGLTDITPTVACGRYPAKAVVGRPIDIGATVFREGHDAVAANVVFRPAADTPAATGPLERMAPGIPGTDRWAAQVTPDTKGRWNLTVEAWSDPLETWRHTVEVKIAAGQGPDELANDLETGALLLERIVERPRTRLAGVLQTAITALRDASIPVARR